MLSYENSPVLFGNVGFRTNLLIPYWYKISICFPVLSLMAWFVIKGDWKMTEHWVLPSIALFFFPRAFNLILEIYPAHFPQVFCRWKEEKMIDLSVRKLIRISLKWWTVLRECPNLRAINLLTVCRKSAKKGNGLSLKFLSMLLF